MSTPKRRILPPIWLLAAILASYALNRWLPIVTVLPEPWNYAGILLMIPGGFMSISSAMSFRRAGTPVIPFSPSTALVSSGWFRVTRNPMYLGMVITLTGVGLLAGSLGALLPVPAFIAIIHFRFILSEEKFLEEIFGQQYRDFCARVRRWI